MMEPVLEDLAGRLENVAKIAKVDTDKSPRLGGKYQVEALPTLILFYKGQVIERFVGYRTADQLESEVKQVSVTYVLPYKGIFNFNFNWIADTLSILGSLDICIGAEAA